MGEEAEVGGLESIVVVDLVMVLPLVIFVYSIFILMGVVDCEIQDLLSSSHLNVVLFSFAGLGGEVIVK